MILVVSVLAAPLPTVNGDSGTWGTILNTFLGVSLSSTGTLNSDVVGTAQITDGVIVNADVSTSAAIALSKLASGTDGQIIVVNGDGVPTYVTMGTDATISNTGALTIAANSVALGTDTTNNYVATLTDSGAGIFTIANSGAESAAVTIAMAADVIDGTELADTITLDATQVFASPSTTAPTPDYNFILDGTGTGADYDSPHLIFRGNDGAANTELDISMFLDVTTTSDYKIAFYNDGASTEVGSFDESGNLQGDGTIDFSGAATFRGGSVTVTDGTNTLFALSDGGTTGTLTNIATITLAGTGTLNGLDSIDSIGESTLEAALDIGGDVTGTGLSSVSIAADVVNAAQLADIIDLGGASETSLTFTASTTGPIAIFTNSAADATANDIMQISFSGFGDVGVGTDDTFISFQSAGGELGDISGTGVSGTLLYQTFTGGHYSETDEKNLELGEVLVSTGELLKNTVHLPKVARTSIAKDSRVYGVYAGLKKRDNSTRFGEKDLIDVAALGTGRILVTDTNGNINNGDLITTSTRSGYGQKQDDDLMHSYTVAKATESVDWSKVKKDSKKGFKWKLIAATYHAG